MIRVMRSSMPPLEEYVDEIRELWNSRWLTNMGEKHRQLTESLQQYLGVEYLDLLCNGHMALELTLQAMHLSGEVITTPFTFASTTHAIVRNGLTPVFCDIHPEDYTIDVEKIEALITDRTTAILPVHVYGNLCDVEAIEDIAKRYGLKVIYDAAHAFGEWYHERPVGSYGDAACFSFHATKVFHTIEGGAVCFRDVELGRQIYNLKNFGIRGPEEVESIGANAKMNEFQAAMGICNLRHIDAAIRERKTLTEHYMQRLSEVPGIKLRTIQQGVRSNYAYFPVVIEEQVFGETRDAVADRLRLHGIEARKYFYPLTSAFSCYAGQYDAGATPVARAVSGRVLTLPLYEGLPVEQVDAICDIIVNKG